MSHRSDILIIGGGIVGLSTAFAVLTRSPGKKVILVEKESGLARHQSGHNSGVLHSGIYYKPGSLKAENCRMGKRAMEEFCAAEGLDFEICGKVIVAVAEEELPVLERILERGQANGVDCRMIGGERLREIEPHAAGIKAIHVPEAGIVDYGQVCERLGDRIRGMGGEIFLDARVTGFRTSPGEVAVETTRGAFVADRVVNCGGLHSDRLARLSGKDPQVKIVPFRGEYFKLKPEAEALVNHLVYPVPDPAFPFLGVHFTRMIEGGVECGPNAVLACSREGYEKFNFHVGDLCESLTYPGFLKLAARYWKTGAAECWRSISKPAFARALSRLVPEIRASHLEPAPAGVRAQAVSSAGEMVDDFLIVEHERVVNVCNAPSPAATASLAIGQRIAERATRSG
ncbi:MAG: L-2-hydroxyglutarate oxidase [Verrucomicrobiales bacterium]